MFLPNDVIQYPAPVRALRVLWIERERGLAWTFDLGQARSQPRAVSLRLLADDVTDGRARLLPQDPFAALPAPAALPQKHRELQARAWAIVGSLQANAPVVYRARERAALVADCAERHGVSRATVLRYLRRYWERGQTIDALLPDYANSGARGKTRAARADVKRGRPRTSGGHPGLNIDATTRAVFRAALARHRAMHAASGVSRRAAYRQMLEEFYRGCAPDMVPSFGQFSYWLDRDGASAPVQHATTVAVQHSTPA
jgi:hypothetical protein